MTRDSRLLIQEILESIDRIEEYTRGLDEEAFRSDVQLQDAVIRRFEIIGEATKFLPDELKARYPHIRWSDIAGLRDILIHGYHKVNVVRVWQVIEDDLPDLGRVMVELAEKA